MPNVWSCSTEWFEQMVKDQEKVVVTTWREKESEKINEMLEKLAKLEEEGTPIFVIDLDSCPAIGAKLGLKEAGETIVFELGKEKGRTKLEEGIEKVKALI